MHAFRVRRITDDSMSPRRDLIYTPYIQRLRLICHSFARVPPQPSPPPKRLSCPLVILYLERGFQNASDPAATTAGPTNAASATGCIEKRCIPHEGQIPLEQKNKDIRNKKKGNQIQFRAFFSAGVMREW